MLAGNTTHQTHQVHYVSEQQKAAVEHDAKYKLINGCAGSRKTDTLIKCAVRDLHTKARPILFLTMVSSVTYELKTRLEHALNINLTQLGNNYVGWYVIPHTPHTPHTNIPICISNYDAWVHLMFDDLLARKLVEPVDGDQFTEKANRVNAVASHTAIDCLMRTTAGPHCAEFVLLDEAQDLRPFKMQLLIHMLKNPKIAMCIAGDYLQTIFTGDSNASYELNTSAHSMNIFKLLQSLHPTNYHYFDLNICFRCPAAHVNFANHITSDFLTKYGLQPMQTLSTDLINKPVLFTHLATSGDNKNINGRKTAEYITKIIDCLMCYDATIKPGDIVVIAASSNENATFEQLKDTLKTLYAKRGYQSAVKHLKTYEDGKHRTINWDTAAGKTTLLSIHGDKGKGHRVVFVIGLTEGSVPRNSQVYNSTEIVAESLLNVGITRSTEYLFIGMSHGFPSRYIKNKYNGMDQHCYKTWKSSTVRQPYADILKLKTKRPYYDNPNYLVSKSLVGDKTQLSVKMDIARGFEHTRDLIDTPLQTLRTKFGDTQTISVTDDDLYVIVGTMSELLIHRCVNKDDLMQRITKMRSTIAYYTDDERLISFMSQLNLEHPENTILYLKTTCKQFLRNNPDFKRQLFELIRTRKRATHIIFNSPMFIKDLDEFASDVPNHELQTTCCWNIALFYNQMTQALYKPAINSYIGGLTCDLATLHANIAAYTATIANHNLQFEQSVNAYVIFNEQQLAAINQPFHCVSISGRYDIYNQTTKTLIEIKASNLQHSHEWLLQVLMYAIMARDLHNVNISEIAIVNILRGEVTTLSLNGNLPRLADIIPKIGAKFEWTPLEIDTFINMLKN